MTETLMNVFTFAKNMWEFETDCTKRLPYTWDTMCNQYDEQTIKTAMIMHYKENMKFDPYNKRDVKTLYFYCRMLVNFKVYEINEEAR